MLFVRELTNQEGQHLLRVTRGIKLDSFFKG